MTPATFRARLKAMRLPLGEFATITGVTPATVSRWGGAIPTFPGWVDRLLAEWEMNGLPPMPAPPMGTLRRAYTDIQQRAIDRLGARLIEAFERIAALEAERERNGMGYRG
jgi:hypothetical protein